MAQIKIHVLPEDITKGRPMNPNACPVAQAIERCLTKGVYCTVEEDEITLYDETGSANDITAVAVLSEDDRAAVNAFIDAFDEHKKVEPFEFSMNIPDWAVTPVKPVASSRKKRKCKRDAHLKTGKSSTPSQQTTPGDLQ